MLKVLFKLSAENSDHLEMTFLANTFPVTAFVSIEQSPFTTVPPTSSCMHQRTQLLRQIANITVHQRLKWFEIHENIKKKQQHQQKTTFFGFTVILIGGLSMHCDKNSQVFQHLKNPRYNTDM